MGSRTPSYDLPRTAQPYTAQLSKDDTKSTENREIVNPLSDSPSPLAVPIPTDSGYGGHERANEESDRKDREAYPTVPQRSAYRSIIGPTPQCGPDDRAGAAEYFNKIMTAIEMGGWTRNEWRRLNNLALIWQARAFGLDIRYKVVGNRNCGMTWEERKAYAAYKALNSIDLRGSK